MYIVLHALAVAQPQIALNVITVKGFFEKFRFWGLPERFK